MPDRTYDAPPHPYQEWRVVSVRSGKTVDNPKGPGHLTAFYVDFEGVEDGYATPDGAYWRRKSDNEPKMGDTFWGEITVGEYGLRFTWDNQRPTTSAQTPPKANFKAAAGPGPQNTEDPGDRQRSIVRQSSQKQAIEFLKTCGNINPEYTPEWLEMNLPPIIDWFVSDSSGLPMPTAVEPDDESVPF